MYEVVTLGNQVYGGFLAAEILSVPASDLIDENVNQAKKKNQTFFHFIFPQAVRKILPVYRGEITTLLKGTAVAGYISVRDLTKMSDIIRSRTNESFFPLIATAVIYFALAWILSVLFDQIMKGLDPSGRKRRWH